MTEEQQQLRSIADQIKEKQATLAKHRDEWRELIKDAGDVLESIEFAHDDIEEALNSLENAIDSLSQQQ